jgi:tetratricopeptide (TPR) repeat protein
LNKRDHREHVEALAWHYINAGAQEEAVEVLEDLGERLASMYRYDQAIAVLEECRIAMSAGAAGSPYARVSRRLAELKGRTGDIDGAKSLIDEVARVVTGSQATIDLMVFKAKLLVECGELDEASELLDWCLGMKVTSQVEQRLIALSAQVSLRRQELVRVRTSLERLAPVSMSSEIGFEIASLWAGYLAATGDFVAARSWGEQAVAAAQALGRINLDLRSRRQLGVLEMLNGRLRAAHSLLTDVFQTSSELSFSIGLLESGVNLMHVEYLLGALPESELIALKIARLSDSPFWQGFIRSNLASVKFEANALGEAESLAKSVLEHGVALTSLPPRIGARGTLSRIHIARRNWESAETELHEAAAETSKLPGRDGLRLSIRTAASELAWHRGDWDRALKEAEEAEEFLGHVERPLHVTVLRLKGMALAKMSREQGAQVLRHAHSLSRVMEMKLEEARILMALGACEPSESSRCFKEAAAVFRRCRSERGLFEVAAAESALLTS